MRTHYELLTVDPAAQPDEIKQAFRREIARYHPDKVHHLGQEFQAIAASRAAELTEAYRVLMDEELRRRYDVSLSDVSQPQPRPHQPTGSDASPQSAAGIDVLRRAVLERIRGAVAALGARPESCPGVDGAFAITGRKTLFKKPEPDVRLLVRVVQTADTAAVVEAWRPAARAGAAGNAVVCLLLLSSRLAPARELAAAISEQRRKYPQAAPLVIPVDMRDWEALLPPETPMAVRSLLDRLRQGD